MNIKKLFVVFLILLPIISTCLYNKNHAPKTITIGVFAENNWDVPSGEPNAVFQEVIEKFKEEHPDVTISFVSGIPKSEYSEWLAEKILSGDEPDLFIVPTDDFSTYASIGVLANLDKTIEQDNSFNINDYYPATTSVCQHNNSYYALPVECSPTLMFVNKTLLAKENITMPSNNWTWTDFYNICKQITKDTNGDGRIDQYGCYDYTWKYAALTNGVELFSNNGTSSHFATPEMEEAISHMISLWELNRGYEVNNRDFDLGNVAFRPFTFAEYRTYLPYPWRIKKYTTFEWDVVAFPAGPKGSNISPISTLVMGMSNRTRQPKLAWEFLKMLSYDKDTQISVLQHTQGLPVRRDILNDPISQDIFNQAMGDEETQMPLAAIHNIVEQGIAEKYFRKYNDVMLLADTHIRKIIIGTLPLNNSLNRIQKEINTYLDE